MNEPQSTLMWLNHFDLLPGDPSVTTSFNAINSGVGGELTGLVIQSDTTGEIGQGGGNTLSARFGFPRLLILPTTPMSSGTMPQTARPLVRSV
jgi:hypothetical protein